MVYEQKHKTLVQRDNLRAKRAVTLGVTSAS